jgi:hypothetical protein
MLINGVNSYDRYYISKVLSSKKSTLDKEKEQMNYSNKKKSKESSFSDFLDEEMRRDKNE